MSDRHYPQISPALGQKLESSLWGLDGGGHQMSNAVVGYVVPMLSRDLK